MTGGGRIALVRLVAAYAVSLTGTRMSAVALPWFVLVTTGSATRTGLVLFAEMAPYVVVKALAGPIIDRRGPRPISVGTDVVSAVLVAAIPILYASGALRYGVLLALVAMIGAARGPGDAAKAALVPRVAETAGVRLERATGLVQTVERLSTALGPAIAAALIAVVEPTTALLVDAASFACAALLLAPSARLVRRSRKDSGPVHAEPEPYLRRLRAGADFLRRDRLLRALVLMIAVTNLIDAAFIGVLLPVWADETGRGVAAYGILLTVFSGTAVAGSLIAAAIAHRLPRRLTFFACFLLGAPPLYLTLAANPPTWTIAAVYAACGLLTGFVNPILSTVMLQRIPANLTGRVLALVQSAAWAGIPLGGLVGGLLTEAVGVTTALLVCGATYLVVIAAPATQPGWRAMDRRPIPSEPVPELERR
jgi:predicted MFS family arabinose efflux permease